MKSYNHCHPEGFYLHLDQIKTVISVHVGQNCLLKNLKKSEKILADLVKINSKQNVNKHTNLVKVSSEMK